ncbi:MAG TPA: DUF2062 domain-containing protein [Luteibaculaceae bacterium]|nr:DUF2062 domain-containing protein [Luteibaculaceae bacterium]
MKNWLNRRLVKPITSLLTQGVNPKELALACSFGFFISFFPVFGSHTLLCLALIAIFRVNPAITLLINNLSYPLLFVAYIPLLQAGNWLFGINESIDAGVIFETITTKPLKAIEDLWWITMRAIAAWFALCSPLFALTYLILLRLFRAISAKQKSM